MGITYEVDVSAGIMVEYWSGLVTPQTLVDHLTRVRQDPAAAAREWLLR